MTGGTDNLKLPRWDLKPVYPGFDSEKYRSAEIELKGKVDSFTAVVQDETLRREQPETWLARCISSFNEVSDLYEDLYNYAYARFSTDTNDAECVRELGKLELTGLPLKKGSVLFRNALAEMEDPPGMAEKHPETEKFAYFIREQLFYQQKQMSPEEEDLANDLSRSGGDAWSRLQEAVSSNLKTVWNTDTGEEKTVVDLRELAFHQDREVRERAFRKELELWKQVKIPMAFALNGVKGFSHVLNTRRNYPGTLSRSIRQNRMSEKALNAMIGVMEESLPLFRRYLKQKAGYLGLRRCAFFDIFAPIRTSVKTWSFDEARDFILRQFSLFSEELSEFAAYAFDQHWIDAEPRQGKVGGAYCIDFPLNRSTRVLCNFSGSFSSVSTLAHELGHAYHHHVLKDSSYIHRDYPMTLAETASIFSESIVYDGALGEADTEGKIGIIEMQLQDTTQVIVDILSRYYFEQEVMKRRKNGELSPEEFSSIMVDAQKRTYGNGLDESELHPYMWAVKSHYYQQDLAFYNFPYAFGQLFGQGLYSLYKQEGTAFAETYRNILKKTGITDANTLTKDIGFDIEQPDFWRQGISMIEERVNQFEQLRVG